MATAPTERDLRSRVRDTVEYVQMSRAHRKIVAGLQRDPNPGPIRKVLVLASDVVDPVGSRGDDAMITSVIDRLEVTAPGAEVHVTVSSDSTATVPRAKVARLWATRWRLAEVWEQVRQYDAVVAIGADVMDGYYSSVTSMRLWMLCDLMARHRGGHRSKLVGFSFNERPTWSVLKVVSDQVGDDLAINLRDVRSHRRLEETTGRSASLVADCAFMLRPRSIAQEPVAAWLESQRSRGRTVVGLNIHPMLSPTRDRAALTRLAAAAGSAVRRLADDEQCSWVLIPHDHRPVHGDVDLMREVAANADRPDDVHLVETPIDAAQIKQLVGRLDAVVSGRMHLAIAALGSGTPAAGITYQGKFDGLFVDHFGLPSDLLLPAEEAEHQDRFEALCLGLVERRDQLATTVAAALPRVVSLSEANLDGLSETRVADA